MSRTLTNAQSAGLALVVAGAILQRLGSRLPGILGGVALLECSKSIGVLGLSVYKGIIPLGDLLGDADKLADEIDAGMEDAGKLVPEKPEDGDGIAVGGDTHPTVN